MTAIVNGSDATFNFAALEESLPALIRLGQISERDSVKNPSGRNYITSSENEDSATLTASVNFPVQLQIQSDGSIKIIASDYLTGVSYTSGTGGTFKASNWVAAIVEATIYQKGIELNAASNPTAANNISYSIQNANESLPQNANFSASYTLPLTYAMSGDGTKTSKGAAYLL